MPAERTLARPRWWTVQSQQGAIAIRNFIALFLSSAVTFPIRPISDRGRGPSPHPMAARVFRRETCVSRNVRARRDDPRIGRGEITVCTFDWLPRECKRSRHAPRNVTARRIIYSRASVATYGRNCLSPRWERMTTINNAGADNPAIYDSSSKLSRDVQCELSRVWRDFYAVLWRTSDERALLLEQPGVRERCARTRHASGNALQCTHGGIVKFLWWTINESDHQSGWSYQNLARVNKSSGWTEFWRLRS